MTRELFERGVAECGFAVIIYGAKPVLGATVTLMPFHSDTGKPPSQPFYWLREASEEDIKAYERAAGLLRTSSLWPGERFYCVGTD